MIADSLSVATYRYPRCVRASGPGDLAAAERQGEESQLLPSMPFPSGWLFSVLY